MPTKFIYIEGSIATGKTKMINKLVEYIKQIKPDEQIYVIQEYIDYYEEGEKLLEGFLTGTISNYVLQRSILECYVEQLWRIDMTSKANQTIIFERHPYDSLYIFTRRSYEKGEISYAEYVELHEYAYEMFEGKIPDPFIEGEGYRMIYHYPSLSFDFCFHSAKRHILDYCYGKDNKRCITIYVTFGSTCKEYLNIQLELIRCRSRKEEVDSYTIEYLKDINKRYDAFFLC